MKKVKNKLILITMVLFCSILIDLYTKSNHDVDLKLGGSYQIEEVEDNDIEVEHKKEQIDMEKYFRPSNLPILNNRTFDLNKEDMSNVNFKTPQDTILNYFSLLREAANPLHNTKTGCGTLGEATLPYPIAYKYLDESYKNKVSYKKYLKSFENILHINLIKLDEVPNDSDHLNALKYFIELETIEGSNSGVGYFAYYYGYIYLKEENGLYKISDIEYFGENYLCAPYHGWAYDAELSVDIRYGDWCNLIKEKYPIEQDGYKKTISFLGTDGNEYKILFYQLTNGTDKEIAQFKKDENGKWINVILDPTKCLQEKQKQ